MAISPDPNDPHGLTRLSNRAAALAFASAFAVIVALISLPHLWRPDGAVARRAAAGAAALVAVVATGWAWRARAQLRAARLRGERAESPRGGAQAQERGGAHSVRLPLPGAHPPEAGGGRRHPSRSAGR